jgi:peptide deformylase
MAFILYPDRRLATPAAQAPVDEAMRATGERLRAAAAEAQAYGLAAAHIGEVAPIILLNLNAGTVTRDDGLFFNPVITAVAAETASGREASVSLPGVEVEIARPVWADLRYQDALGADAQMRLEGFLARCALHEVDQMNGIFFLSHLSRVKRDMVLRKYEKARRGLI